jgi:ISXO2-like transposase domain
VNRLRLRRTTARFRDGVRSTSASLVGFVADVVEVGPTVVTDGWPAYRALSEAGFVHQRIVEGSGEHFVDPHGRLRSRARLKMPTSLG